MNLKNILTLGIAFILCSLIYQDDVFGKFTYPHIDPDSSIQLIVLGVMQDAGIPQAGCTKKCCLPYYIDSTKRRNVVSLGIADQLNNKNYIIEATPDFKFQYQMLMGVNGSESKNMLNGIFLTHAHIGHYTGLMHLGKEAMNSSDIPVYVMPRMGIFLKTNGPWDQLVQNKNISLHQLSNDKSVNLSERLEVTPFEVPHRDEYSETVGYKITGPNKSALFIPDIDKWRKWEQNISELIREVDYAFLDATFYDAEEINNRDISEIPHPFIIESFEEFKSLSIADRRKIYFIHFNHTNPAINKESNQAKLILSKGYKIAVEGQIFRL